MVLSSNDKNIKKREIQPSHKKFNQAIIHALPLNTQISFVVFPFRWFFDHKKWSRQQKSDSFIKTHACTGSYYTVTSYTFLLLLKMLFFSVKGTCQQIIRKTNSNFMWFLWQMHCANMHENASFRFLTITFSTTFWNISLIYYLFAELFF